MCGIFGILSAARSTLQSHAREKLLQQLFILSESRGKESAGIYAGVGGMHWSLKSAVSAKKFIETRAYQSLQKSLRDMTADGTELCAILAHSRLVTNGTAAEDKNNQPVMRDEVVVVHNGIIVNADTLWQANADLTRSAQVDTEIAAAFLAKQMRSSPDALTATKHFYEIIQGSASIAWICERTHQATLATNTGDLFYAYIEAVQCIVFASERYILQQALKDYPQAENAITWLMPGHMVNVRLHDLTITQGAWQHTCSHDARATHDFPIVLHIPANESLLRYNAKNLAILKRCTRCILPETFPFIHFDDEGVCNYCHGYTPKYSHLNAEVAKKEFIVSLEKYRRSGADPDSIVAFSGGRDSCYGLHLIKKEFGLRPLTFTYDWGMVTDLARRNIARMCGQLGIQNILVSADLQTKRDNIRRNVSAWLKQPDLGLIPLFMAGDKHFFKVTNQLKKQSGIDLDIWCANPLENTDFKSGFCGIAPDFNKTRLDYLSLKRKAQMIAYYGTAFLKNPRYINPSLLDTANAFMAYYIEPRRDFYFMFNHMVWNENEVNQVLLNRYDWETSPDSPSTWRIGDGTAPFYNYIYVTANGFSEFDTFRSNQIREGMITRKEALAHVLEENRPRAQSIRWYLETIGLDFNATISRINTLDVRELHG